MPMLSSDRSLSLRSDLEVNFGGLDRKNSPFWIIFDSVSDKYYHVDRKEYEVISRMNGSTTPEKILAELKSIESFDVKFEELKEIIVFLSNNHLLSPVYGITEKRVANEVKSLNSNTPLKKLLSSYLYFKIPLIYPDKLLDSTVPYFESIFNTWVKFSFIIIAIWGYIQLFPNWSTLKFTVWDSFNLKGSIFYVLAIIAVKIIHEFSHAIVAKSVGVRVRELGIAFVILIPRLYTDVTDSWKLTDRSSKMKIDIAGIVVELIIGGICALIWSVSNSGPIQSIVYYLFAVSAINTILFNGNPLMRFDGYYLLSDFLKIDNLQSKAISQLKLLFRYIFFSIKFSGKISLPLFGYGCSIFVYRLFLYSTIIGVIYFKFVKTIGIILAVGAIYSLFILPVRKEILELKTLLKNQKKVYLRFISIITLILVSILLIPIPIHKSFPCIIKPQNRSLIYVESEGYLNKIYFESGAVVEKGSTLFKLKNPLLMLDEARNHLELSILQEEFEQLQTNQKTLGEFKMKKLQIESFQKVLDEYTIRHRLLEIKAEIGGNLIIYDSKLSPGKWLSKGELIGEIYSDNNTYAEVYVNEKDFGTLSNKKNIRIAMPDELEKFDGKLISYENIAIKGLKHSPIMNIYGGRLQGIMKDGYWYSRTPLYKFVFKIDGNLESPLVGRSATAEILQHTTLGSELFSYLNNFSLLFDI